jgi:hypothetical protein
MAAGGVVQSIPWFLKKFPTELRKETLDALWSTRKTAGVFFYSM